MRITFVLENACMAGGIRVASIYADRLQRRGHDVVVVSTPIRPPSLRRKVSSFVKGRGWLKDPDFLWPSHLDTLDVDHRILRKYRPIDDRDVPDADVVVATWWETAEWVDRLSPSKGAKAYLIQHDEGQFENQPTERVAATWRLPLHKITISKWLMDLAARRCGNEYVSHVPNSVDTDQFQAEVRGRQRRPTVGFLYNPTPFKGCSQAVETINRAMKEIPETRCVSFGTFPLSNDYALPPNCDYTSRPPQDQIRGLYASCDVWLCASRSEGFHLPPLEAMACRCPVVSTRVGGSVDTVVEGVNGHLVDVGDVDTLTDRLLRVLRLPGDHWRQMSDAAYATARRYTWDNATDLFEEALHVAIDKSHGRSISPRSSVADGNRVASNAF